MLTKQLLCLANSRKPDGRCIAGVDRDPAAGVRWIRPVSSRPNHSVSAAERQYPGGLEPSLLDVIEVPLRSPVPFSYQQENWLLDSTRPWRKVGEMKLNDLARVVTPDIDPWSDPTTPLVLDRVYSLREEFDANGEEGDP